MKITITKDFRGLKKDTIYSFIKNEINIIVGDNGSGKSSLLMALRNYYKINSKNYMVSKLKDISVNETFDEAFAYDSYLDDPKGASMIDMDLFLMNGGMQTLHKSNGETTFIKLVLMFKDVSKVYGKDILIILDEPERGLSFKNKLFLIDIIKHINMRHKVTFIISTHDTMFMELNESMLNIENNKIVNELEYKKYLVKKLIKERDGKDI